MDTEKHGFFSSVPCRVKKSPRCSPARERRLSPLQGSMFLFPVRRALPYAIAYRAVGALFSRSREKKVEDLKN